MILMTVAYGLYFMTSVEAISGLGQLIGRGALISMVLVLFLLPCCLMIFDKWIVKADYAEKKHAKMNRIRAKTLKLPILSELHRQRLALRSQIREYRRARRRAFRSRVKRLFRKNAAGDASKDMPEHKDNKEENSYDSR